jgi:hypothetical protein
MWICSPINPPSVVHSTWPSWAMWRTHAPTCNKWHKKKNKNKKVTLRMLTHGTMRGCGLISWAICNNDIFHDIRERNMTTRSEIWSANIRFLGFMEIRRRMTLWGLISRSVGCIIKIQDLKFSMPWCLGNLCWELGLAFGPTHTRHKSQGSPPESVVHVGHPNHTWDLGFGTPCEVVSVPTSVLSTAEIARIDLEWLGTHVNLM